MGHPHGSVGQVELQVLSSTLCRLFRFEMCRVLGYWFSSNMVSSGCFIGLLTLKKI
jgi:hypothetical protein